MGMITSGGIFTDICFDLTSLTNFNKLVQDGYLARLITKKTKNELDVSGVKLQSGEFSAHDLQAAVDKESITESVLDEIEEAGRDRFHCLLFASGVEHAHHIHEKLVDRGHTAICVDGAMSSESRDKAISDFRNGKVRFAVNNNVLTTGFDYPDIDLIAMMRPTRSTGLWVQMLGRGTRPSEGKDNCLVLDFAGNTKRLGPINDPVLPKQKDKGVGGSAPVKECPECGVYCHASATHCEECGHIFPREVKIHQHASDKDVMVELVKPEINWYSVTRVHYELHSKPGRPASIQVTYYCGFQMFREWICLEHIGYARRRAVEWWRERDPSGDVPAGTLNALALCPKLPVPTRVRVWVNKKYPEIMGTEFF